MRNTLLTMSTEAELKICSMSDKQQMAAYLRMTCILLRRSDPLSKGLKDLGCLFSKVAIYSETLVSVKSTALDMGDSYAIMRLKMYLG